MADVLQIVILLLILIYLIGMKRSLDASASTPSSGADEPLSRDVRALGARIETLQTGVNELRSWLRDMKSDHDILDELEENVMSEWARAIEDKLGKKPVMLGCPACGYDEGLEPNLLSDDDTEYGCPSCGAIHTVESLRERYPDAIV